MDGVVTHMYFLSLHRMYVNEKDSIYLAQSICFVNWSGQIYEVFSDKFQGIHKILLMIFVDSLKFIWNHVSVYFII